MLFRSFYPAEAVAGILDIYNDPGGINFGRDLQEGPLHPVMSVDDIQYLARYGFHVMYVENHPSEGEELR